MLPRLACAALSAVVLLSCTAASPKPTREDALAKEQEALRAEVAEISARVERLLRVQDEAVWANWTTGAPVDIAATYEGEETLFTPETIQRVGRAIELTTDPGELRALASLKTYLVGEYLARGLAEIADAIANLSASLSFTANGREHAYRDLERLLANERNAERRRALYEGATPAIERISQSVRRKEEKIHELLRELGYPGYEAYAAELRQADLGRLGLLAEEILQVTEKPYREVIDALAQRELGYGLEKLRRADLARLFKPKAVDAFFPREEVLPRVRRTLEPMKLSLEALEGVTVDTRSAPEKNPRPLTLAPTIPSDVRVSLVPSGGVHDQGRVLHEVGHALHFALTREPRFELRKLGNSTVVEAYAHLFEDLVVDPVWLEQQTELEGEKLKEYLAASSAQRLFAIRRAAGLLVYQLRARQTPGDLEALYGQVMERTYQMPMADADRARHLVELEDFFQSADTFRAWFLAGQLQGQLKARFGPSWWSSAEAGEFLRALFAKGNGASAREIAQSFGADGVRPDVLLLRLGATLDVPMTLPTTPLETPSNQDHGKELGWTKTRAAAFEPPAIATSSPLGRGHRSRDPR